MSEAAGIKEAPFTFTVAEDHVEDECHDCRTTGEELIRVAAWLVVSRDTCEHTPNPTPVCDPHKDVVVHYLGIYGWEGWSCQWCHHMTDIVDIRRIPR